MKSIRLLGRDLGTMDTVKLNLPSHLRRNDEPQTRYRTPSLRHSLTTQIKQRANGDFATYVVRSPRIKSRVLASRPMWFWNFC